MNARSAAASSAMAAVLIASGVCLGARPAWHAAVAAVARAAAHATWDGALREPDAGGAPGSAACWLRIRDCGIDTLVTHGDTARGLLRTPCLTRLGGRTVITAHRDKHFRGLADLAIGSRIDVTDRRARRTPYRVTDIEILSREQAEARLLEPRDGPSLVLMTCYPLRYIGPAPLRLVAWAAEETAGNDRS